MAKTIAITDYDYPDLSVEREVVADRDVELVALDERDPDGIVEAAPDVDGLLVQHATVDERVFESLDLDGVGRYGIGVDTVDLEAADRHGVPVMNVPDYCIEEVPTHALALLLACERRIARYDAEIKRGTWDWTIGRPIARITGTTLGLIGFGKLPRRLVELVDGFDMEVLVYDPYVDDAEVRAAGCEKVPFEEVLERSKYVSVHAPLTDETRNLFDTNAFDRMRDDAILINTARGGLVDVDALQEAIENGTIAGAGIDVLPKEPPEPTPPFVHENVVYTPHVAWYSSESVVTLRRTVTEDVCAAVTGGSPKNVVNDP